MGYGVRVIPPFNWQIEWVLIQWVASSPRYQDYICSDSVVTGLLDGSGAYTCILLKEVLPTYPLKVLLHGSGKLWPKNQKWRFIG